MIELFQEATALYNLPATLLLALVVVYWLMVLVGVTESDSEPLDIDGDGIADVGADSHGFWPTCGRFLHLGQVPLMIVISFFAVGLWVFSVLGNYFYNGESGDRSLGRAVLLLLPNVILSLLLTHVFVAPFRKLFNAMDQSASEVEAVLGREGVVASNQVDERYGQVSVNTGAAPLLINVRVAPGEPSIAKGTTVLVTTPGPDHAFYFVQPVPAAIA